MPLLACLLALSVWPAAITERSFANDRAGSDVRSQFAVATPVQDGTMYSVTQTIQGVGSGGVNGSGTAP